MVINTTVKSWTELMQEGVQLGSDGTYYRKGKSPDFKLKNDEPDQRTLSNQNHKRIEVPGSADKICGWPGCTNNLDPSDGIFCRPHINKKVTQVETLQNKDEPALRYDKGKARYDLIPGDALEALAWVYTEGAKKYSDRNWEKGMSYSRCFGSLMRHIWVWWRGETNDPETGCHHMVMAAWNCLALFCYESRKVGNDDRPTNASV